ncbi:MAG: class I SAM-dependent methyltransferase, partial [Firmicutes bacterium]|nr:class I SAM-dependent methyltransferase [Bacillota bacterium]
TEISLNELRRVDTDTREKYEKLNIEINRIKSHLELVNENLKGNNNRLNTLDGIEVTTKKLVEKSEKLSDNFNSHTLDIFNIRTEYRNLYNSNKKEIDIMKRDNSEINKGMNRKIESTGEALELKIENMKNMAEKQRSRDIENAEKYAKIAERLEKAVKSGTKESITEIGKSVKDDEMLDYIKEKLNIYTDIELLKDAKIDYFDFENKFRGSRSVIKESQRDYLGYYEKGSDDYVLDIGCGRGEFLELMKENGIKARGIDVYEPFVEFCKGRGLMAQQADALGFVSSLEDESLNGIFMGQVIEHINTDYAIALIREAKKKLKKGCYFILETPNPQNLGTYFNFYLDPSHIKPVHFMLTEYLFSSAGYERVERYNNEFSKIKVQIPHIEGEGIENKKEINSVINFLNERILGYCDYTLIAKK